MPLLGDQPYAFGVAITTSDTVDLVNGLTDAVYVGGAGVVVAVWQDGKTANFTAVAGQTLPIKVKRINATSTTATLLVALYYEAPGTRNLTTVLTAGQLV